MKNNENLNETSFLTNEAIETNKSIIHENFKNNEIINEIRVI